jgi:hypothetical protein
MSCLYLGQKRCISLLLVLQEPQLQQWWQVCCAMLCCLLECMMADEKLREEFLFQERLKILECFFHAMEVILITAFSAQDLLVFYKLLAARAPSQNDHPAQCSSPDATYRPCMECGHVLDSMCHRCDKWVEHVQRLWLCWRFC